MEPPQTPPPFGIDSLSTKPVTWQTGGPIENCQNPKRENRRKQQPRVALDMGVAWTKGGGRYRGEMGGLRVIGQGGPNSNVPWTTICSPLQLQRLTTAGGRAPGGVSGRSRRAFAALRAGSSAFLSLDQRSSTGLTPLRPPSLHTLPTLRPTGRH